MIYELMINLGNTKHKAFLQNGFDPAANQSLYLHRHTYAEIHLVTGGEAEFVIDDRTVTVSDGGMLVLPRATLHRCSHIGTGARRSAFQIDCDVHEVALYSLPPEPVSAFFREIKQAITSGRYTEIAAYIALFCGYLDTTPPYTVALVSDYGLLIHEFFSIHYREPITLSDLARELHLSDRQTERLVLTHTGNTFRSELTRVRLSIAEQLMKDSSLSLNEIAHTVGYGSYAGFWKAMKKYGELQN